MRNAEAFLAGKLIPCAAEKLPANTSSLVVLGDPHTPQDQDSVFSAKPECCTDLAALRSDK